MSEEKIAYARRREWESKFGATAQVESYFIEQVYGHGRPPGGVMAEMELMLSLGIIPKPD